jgi:DNA helicase IV
MEWRREAHLRAGTTLIETFSYEASEGVLEQRLEERLREHGLCPQPLNVEEYAALIADEHQCGFCPFVTLLATFLNLRRNVDLSQQQLVQSARNDRDRAFLTVFGPIEEAYNECLATNRQIDFHDMLSQARDLLLSGESKPGFRYVLVDEFQDTSRVRVDLVRALRDQRDDCRVFLVGDDWQAIYRFAGADVGLFRQVDQHLGTTVRTVLDETFRLPPRLLSASSRFVLENPTQLPKPDVVTRREQAGLASIALVYHCRGVDREARHNELRSAISTIQEDGLVEGGTLLVLGRYNFAIEELEEEIGVERLGASETRFLTVHRAKGTEADCVIIIGNESGTYGFPSEISDDPVLALVTADADVFPFGEERRLFYVALSRARKQVYLLVNSDHPSRFTQELLSQPYADEIRLLGEHSERHNCPKCAGRTVRSKNGPHGDFWACLRYPVCDGTLACCSECRDGAVEPQFREEVITEFVCTACNHSFESCPRCRPGFLTRRDGRNGPFLGCSRFGPDDCRETRNL